MAVFGVGFCLPVLVACVIVSIPFVQGRSLRRRHGHHSHSDYYNLEELLPRHLTGRLEDDLDFSYGQTKRRQVLGRSSEHEDSEERVPPFFHRYKHEYGSKGRESLRRKEDFLRKHDDVDALSMGYVARRKRHNKKGRTVSYQRISEQDKTNLSRQRNHRFDRLHSGESGGFHAIFELEVKEAQNSSICNYTVESIPDTRGSRVPKDLEHVRCNHIGSSCQGTGTYCCIQTYRNIDVSYGDGDKETIKLYVGCVCALQDLNSVQVVESQLPIND